MSRDRLTPPAPGPGDDIEQRVRVVLHQRAETIRPQPPTWEELVNRPEGVVVPLEVGEDLRHRRRGRGAWLRPGLAAASVALIVLTAAVVMENTGGDSSNQANSSSAAGDPAGPGGDEGAALDDLVDGMRLPAPGNEDYQAWTSPPLYPAVDLTTSIPPGEVTGIEETGSGDLSLSTALPWQSAANWRDVGEQDLLRDPGLLAEDYLRMDAAISDQLDEGLEVQIDGPQSAELDGATVPWSMNDVRPNADDNKPIDGIVFLRPFEVIDDPESPQRWAVVGVRTEGLQLQDVRREGDMLVFSVNRQSDLSEFSDIRVQVNQETLDEGQIGRNRSQEFQYPLLESETATIRLQHMLNGEPISITEMIVPPTELALELGAYDDLVETQGLESDEEGASDGGG